MRAALLSCLVLPVTLLVPHNDTVQPPSAELFAFRSSFWNNLHHFLYVLGRARNGTPDSRRAAVVNAPNDVEGLSERPEAERSAWDAAVAFYAAGPSKKDAVFDSDLVSVTRALAAAPDASDLSGTGLDPALVAALQRAAPVYRAVWWTRHAQSNATRRSELEHLLALHGPAAVGRVTSLYGTSWPAAPPTIDLSAYTNWAGAYSTEGGLIVMASTYDALSGPAGLELLLHEASHQWDEEIQRRLTKAAGQRRAPNGLSHALIFYTSGEIVRERIAGYIPYATANGVWNRGANPMLKPLLDQYWLPYIRGEATFDAAIAAIAAHAR